MSLHVSSIASLTSSKRLEFLASLTDEEILKLPYIWGFWAREDQLPPPGDWVTWVILAGRGWGKTRTGAEWVRDQVCGPTPLARGTARRIALVAETAADGRDVMVEGETGLLAVHPKDFRPLYEPSKRRLTWPNGATATTFNAVEPDQLRGPQHSLAWCDELAKWRYAHNTWDMLQFGLRLGNPRQIVTTTPKPIKVLKEIIAAEGTHVTWGSTYDNRANLAPAFFKTIVARYEGTRLGRQELNAEILDDAEGALWTRDLIEENRIAKQHAAGFKRIVVAVDPATTNTEDSDEHGIVVAGLGFDDHGYVIEDLSERLSPEGMCRKAILAYDRWKADRLVAEVNNGGDWIGTTVAATAKIMHEEGSISSPEVAYSKVWAMRSKQARAEPISALDEQHRIHHIGAFPEMEDEMCSWEPLAGLPSPNRIDARVWGFYELMMTGEHIFEDHSQLVETDAHPAFADWPRVCAIDIKGARVSAVWAAWDAHQDIVHLYGEYIEDRARLEVWASAIRKRGDWIPVIFAPKGRKRKEDQADMIVDRLLDEHLDLCEAEFDLENGIDEINARIATQRLKVAGHMHNWFRELRAMRRDDKGKVVDEYDGLMHATGILLVSGLILARVDEAIEREAEDEWAEQTQDRRTGY